MLDQKGFLWGLRLALLVPLSLAAETPQLSPQALVREQGQSEKLFDYFESSERIETNADVQIVTRTRFVDSETGRDAFREVLTTDAEGRLMISYEVEQLQLDEKGSIKVDRKAGKIHFRYFKEGKWKERSETLEEPFIVGAMIPRFIQLYEAQLLAGEKVRFHLAVPYMTKSFNFALTKNDMKDFKGRQLPEMAMSPTNVFVRAAVKPLYFTYDPDSREVRQILGKVFLKKRIKHGFDAFMAETLFLAEPKPAPAAAK